MFDVHPSETGRQGRFIPSILKNQSDAQSEAGWFYCYQCGFPNQKSKITFGDSFDRNVGLLKTTVVTTSDGTESVREFDDSIQGGCRFCHSMNPLGVRQ